jgi:hypothetical protein
MTLRHVYVYSYNHCNINRLENAVDDMSVIWVLYRDLKETETCSIIVRADSEQLYTE